MLVVAAASPEPDALLIDKLLIVCAASHIDAIVAVNKGDLDGNSAKDLCAQYARAAKGVFSVEAARGTGVPALKEALRGKVHAFGGQSGVGKSTLINACTAVLGDRLHIRKDRARQAHHQKVRADRSGRRHDGVRHAGFSLMELPLMDPEELPNYYPELAPFEGMCRFSPCSHRSEPGCAAKEALARGEIDEKRYERYLQIYQETLQKWRDRYD